MRIRPTPPSVGASSGCALRGTPTTHVFGGRRSCPRQLLNSVSQESSHQRESPTRDCSIDSGEFFLEVTLMSIN
jgi:hypothetical protein